MGTKSEISLSAFVTKTAALVDLEKNAEVAKVQQEMRQATEQSQQVRNEFNTMRHGESGWSVDVDTWSAVSIGDVRRLQS